MSVASRQIITPKVARPPITSTISIKNSLSAKEEIVCSSGLRVTLKAGQGESVEEMINYSACVLLGACMGKPHYVFITLKRLLFYRPFICIAVLN